MSEVKPSPLSPLPLAPRPRRMKCQDPAQHPLQTHCHTSSHPPLPLASLLDHVASHTGDFMQSLLSSWNAVFPESPFHIQLKCHPCKALPRSLETKSFIPNVLPEYSPFSSLALSISPWNYLLCVPPPHHTRSRDLVFIISLFWEPSTVPVPQWCS